MVQLSGRWAAGHQAVSRYGADVPQPGQLGEAFVMTLEIIGSGFGRTGTMSLKRALDQIGFGPCHHMEEVFAHPEQVPHWQALVAGGTADWGAVFAGYRSQVDWPGAHYWRELAAAYPNAKVIHTARPEELWWKSFSSTIGALLSGYDDMRFPPHVR